VCHPIELGPDGVVELAFAVPVHVHPEGGNPIEVAASVEIEEVVSLGAFDDERFHPLAHLGKRMPNVALVFLTQVHGRLTGSGHAARADWREPARAAHRYAWP
jgi:hypothetical protein